MVGDRRFAIDVMDLFYDKWDPAGVGAEGKDHSEYEAYIGAFAGLVSKAEGALSEDDLRAFVADTENHVRAEIDADRVSDAMDRMMKIIRDYEDRSGKQVLVSRTPRA